LALIFLKIAVLLQYLQKLQSCPDLKKIIFPFKMPPRRQRHNDLELEDLKMQIQQLQETVNAQQILLD
jgi:hypothetical protein